MEKDSRHAHKSDHMTANQHDSQQLQSQIQSFQCNYCILIFKSKQFLHEHVSKVHGFNVDVSKSDGDSTPLKTGTKSSSSLSQSDYLGDCFSCRFCVFTSYRWTELVNHEKNYHKSGAKSLVKNQANATVGKNAVNSLGVSQSKLGEKGKLKSPYPMFTSKKHHSHSSSKDLERHKGSPGNTFSVGPSKSTEKSSQGKLKSSDRESDVKVLMERDSKARHSCPSCSFTSSSFTDLRNHQQQKHGKTVTTWPSLGSSPTKQQNSKPETGDGSATKTAAKRTHDASSSFPPKKKRKLDARNQESSVVKTKVSTSSDFNSDFSEAGKVHFGAKMGNHPDFENGESSDESESLICCKHCDYSHKSCRGIAGHYQRMHPFIRFTYKYILDPEDNSATYRCLECPVDFTSVDDLKEHYSVHPGALDVFMHRSDQLDLVFKCFLCTYTSVKSSFLKIHYRRDHSMEEINNPLMYYSYNASNPQAKPSHSPVVTETSSPNSAKSHERVQTQHIETSRTSPLKSPISKGVDKELHHCKICSYSNTSVVAVVVHYQKKHPNSRATIEQIKQASASTLSTPVESPQKSPPESPNSSQKMSDDNPKDLLKMYFCQVCNYKHPKVKGVFVHQKKKHHELRATALQIHIYSEEVRSRSRMSQRSENISSPKSSTSLDLINSRLKDLFFCQLCNYGHPAIRGVLNHQLMRHKEIVANTEQVLMHTSRLREKQSSARESSANSFTLPLPILQKGTEKMKFCQFCNYSHQKATIVAGHQFRKHSILKPSVQEINVYTARVYEKLEKKANTAIDQSKPPVEEVTEPRALTCGTCDYTTPHLYLLKRHKMKKHLIKTTIAKIVQSAYLKGQLESGYHCQWCVYSNPDAKKVQQHYHSKHPLSAGFSLDHITSDLCAGLKASPSKNALPDSETIVKEPHAPQKSTWGKKKTVPIPKPGGKVAKVYPCRACPFKGSSIERVKRHYRAVHPWSVREDGSVLDVITSRQPAELKQNLGDVLDKVPGSFESYQEPVEDCEEPAEDISGDTSHDASTSIKKFECAVCSACFNTHHGLITHCGRKHPDYQPEKEMDDGIEGSVKTSVYKCDVCLYVNTRSHGILTHCQMKHPSFKARAEELQSKIAQFPNMKQCVRKRSGKVTIQGYSCKLCPVTHCSLKKLKVHSETHRHSTALVKLKTAHAIKKQLLSKYRNAQGSVVTSRYHSKRKCHRCTFTCLTMKQLASHIKSSHSCTPEYTYTCHLCPYSSVVPVYLANHYRRMHGPDSYRTYFAETHMRLLQKQSSDVRPSPTPECQPSSGKASAKPLANSDFDCTSEQPAANSAQERSSKTTKRDRTKKRGISNIFTKSSGKHPIKCKRCTKYFPSALLLSIHYTNFHFADFKRDFTILSNTAGTDLQLYRCGHCKAKIKGNQKLSLHLDHHGEVSARTKLKPVVEDQQTKLKPAEPKSQELPELLTVQELSRWNVTKVGKITLKMSPEAPLSETPDLVDLNKGTDEAEGVTCIQCGRMFMSLKGLRSHERSHAAIASLKRTGPKHIIEENIIYRPGTVKKYHCGLCGYKTNLVFLLRNHLAKKHEATDMAECSVKDPDIHTTYEKDADNNLRASEEAPEPTGPQKSDGRPEHSATQKRGYSEPPHVQRQLNHYKHVAKRKDPAADMPPASRAFYDGLYHCEFCNFTSEHISSVRRHYLNRHNGKRLLKCKDCSFFTAFRRRFDMHMDAGGSSCLAEAAMDLRCPFCLYHTKNKNNMIDHIILHREERMVPIEVRRPRLSQYLKDVVFRCHKCTFSSASDENLREHMLKHDSVKPYKCRLCFYDCSQLSSLEAHLCDKHQVVRNHELVGQVSLEQLETKLNEKDKEEEDLGTTLKHTKQEEESDDSNLEQPSAMEVGNLSKHTKEEEEEEDEGMEEREETEENATPWQAKAENAANATERWLHQKRDTDMERGILAEADKEPQEAAVPDMVQPDKHDTTDIQQNTHMRHKTHETQAQEGKFRANCQNTGQSREVIMDGKSQGGLIHLGQGLTEEKDRSEPAEGQVTKKNNVLESFVDCEEKNKRKPTDQYGDMPILENVYIEQEENSNQDERLEDVVVKQVKLSKCNKTGEEGCEPGAFQEEPVEQVKNLDHSNEGLPKKNAVASAPPDSTPFLKNSSVKSYSCELCGRTFPNSTEFMRHVMRHGM